MIVVAGLVLAVFEPFVMSVEVNVAVPAVFAVTESVFVPATSAVLAGSAAFASVELIPTMSVEATTFQFASTALTVTLNESPAVWAVGVPVLPVAVPGAAVSPGSRICSFVNAPPLIVVAGLVFAVIEPFVLSVEVNVAVPAVFGVIEKVFEPATSAALSRQHRVGVGRGDPDGSSKNLDRFQSFRMREYGPHRHARADPGLP